MSDHQLIPVSLLLQALRPRVNEYEAFVCVACKAGTLHRIGIGENGVRLNFFLCPECDGDGTFMDWLSGQFASLAASKDWKSVPGVKMVPVEQLRDHD